MDAQHPILAIGRTGNSPTFWIATLTMARDVGSKAGRCHISSDLGHSPIFCDAAADGLGITLHRSPKLRRRSTRTKAAATNARDWLEMEMPRTRIAKLRQCRLHPFGRKWYAPDAHTGGIEDRIGNRGCH